MNQERPAWQPLDPGADTLPGEIESALGAGGSVSACVVILVDSEIDRDWGAQASLAVAKRWAASGHRVILADGCLDGPVLHEAVGVENGEGVSDMVLYGASAQRFAGRVEDRLMLAPAGTPVVEVADVLEHVRWDMMISGCREVGATLVFHVSTGTPGVEAMTKRAEGVLVLAPASKDVDAILGSASGPLIAIVGPGNGDARPVDAPASADEDSGAVAVEAPPEEVDVDAVSVEAESVASEPVAPESATPESVTSEGKAPPTLTVDDLPDLPEDTVDDTEASDALSVSGLEGAQYQEEAAAASGAAAGATDLDLGAAPEVLSTVDELAEGGAEAEPDGGDQTVAAGTDTFSTADPSLGLEDVETGAAPTLEEPTAFAGALSGLVVEEPAEEVAKTEAPAARRRKYRGLARLERERKRAVILRQFLTAALTIVIVGGGGLAVAYYGLVNIPGITPPDRVRSYVPAPVVLPGPIPRSPIMTHVLFIDSWTTIETPLSTAEALRTRLPNLLFFVTPIELDGIQRFALYVGPAYSAVEANALKEPVSVILDRLNPDDWSVRDAPYAFYFGEYDTVENAQRRIEALAAVSIPAYSLRVEYSDGSTGIRVYGGAFTDEFEAARMGRLVGRADIGGLVLTFRHGTLPE